MTSSHNTSFLRKLLVFTFAILFGHFASGQELSWFGQTNRKGQGFLYWGWNYSDYTKSNIHFQGENYDFVLKRVKATDRQSHFSKDYFRFSTITIPQFNFRVGYFFSEKMSISFGLDHMKYVMVADQVATIDGEISGSGTIYDGAYNDQLIVVSPDLLQFEHTDGLNYTNLELRRLDNVLRWRFLAVDLTTGLGAAVLLPKTNATFLGQERYDDFNIAGYGFDGVVGLGVTFWNYFFVQGEIKGGFIHMPQVRITHDKADHASQHFFFSQYNIVFGLNFPLAKGARVSPK